MDRKLSPVNMLRLSWSQTEALLATSASTSQGDLSTGSDAIVILTPVTEWSKNPSERVEWLCTKTSVSSCQA